MDAPIRGSRGTTFDPPTNGWRKGCPSPNPAGRKKTTDEEKELERKARRLLFSAAPRAVATLVGLLASEDLGAKARAAVAILQKVWPNGIAPDEVLSTATDEALLQEIERRAGHADEPTEPVATGQADS